MIFVLLYAFIGKQVLMNTQDFKRAIFDGPMKYFLIFIAASYVVTTVFNFSGMNADALRLKQLEMAVEWDRMEQTLHDNSFWYFIN